MKYLIALLNSKLIEFDDCGHALMFDQYRKLTHFLLKTVSQFECLGDEDEAANF